MIGNLYYTTIFAMIHLGTTLLERIEGVVVKFHECLTPSLD